MKNLKLALAVILASLPLLAQPWTFSQTCVACPRALYCAEACGVAYGYYKSCGSWTTWKVAVR